MQYLLQDKHSNFCEGCCPHKIRIFDVSVCKQLTHLKSIMGEIRHYNDNMVFTSKTKFYSHYIVLTSENMKHSLEKEFHP